MAERPGVQIYNEFYPFVEQFKHGDPILIYEVTGVDWDTFSDMLAKAGDGGNANPIVQTALIAVAVQRVHTTWSRRQVSEFVRNLELGEETYIGGDEEAAAPIPPAESGESSSSSDAPSEASPESPSSPSQTDSGDPGSATTSPALHQVG